MLFDFHFFPPPVDFPFPLPPPPAAGWEADCMLVSVEDISVVPAATADWFVAFVLAMASIDLVRKKLGKGSSKGIKNIGLWLLVVVPDGEVSEPNGAVVLMATGGGRESKLGRELQVRKLDLL
ncbi:hypothetical protein E2562_023096 [Oryza meyeriana var. granulata]|uniref:Uncharacterized protein n=1 Tax=Oryza meyeriana var. granulata TaxID=110450 RepID=A0A6G1E0D2_9ORYZ|nr:hypothetical protein E2562_023096 [Oryza meyeriana var. granulata]